jgi:cobaltochelatase CobN
MHLLRTETHALDEGETAVDLGQSAAEIVFLSFTDSDLSAFANACEQEGIASARIAHLGRLKHPYSVDLYTESVAAKARFVLVRLLGGMDYWRYGVEELAATARAQQLDLAIVPGDHREDPRLDAASTLAVADLRRLWSWFQCGGPDNLAGAAGWIAQRIGAGPTPWREPAEVPACVRFALGCRAEPAKGAPRALIVFYRSVLMAGDTAPISALAQALGERGFEVESHAVTSLKDPSAVAGLAAEIARSRPDIVLNTTAFSGRSDEGPGVLDQADAPVFQVMLSGSRLAPWRASTRGLAAADLAMNVVLPEVDGRIVTRAISFKAEAEHSAALEFTRMVHQPEPSRVAAVADLALAYARLRRTPRGKRRIACVLSDYPAKGGRAGYAVGLDTPASALAVADALRDAGYAVGAMPDGPALMRALEDGPVTPVLSLADYERLAAALPPRFRDSLAQAWGDPADDPSFAEGAFGFRVVRAGALTVALQPDRGRGDRKASYHDMNLPPRHGYVAFYLWLRAVEAIHALVHLGTHGTLEWLPGKAVALDADCAPEAVLGPVPVVYPFIVNNPGEAAQAKRRIAALTIGHLTPPLAQAGHHGAAAELETLLDEYANAQALDPRRAALLADAILDHARDSGLAGEAGLDGSLDPQHALERLDAWLCDLKDMRIGDGLHVFGHPASGEAHAACLPQAMRAEAMARVAACGAAEIAGLLGALDGRFVQPGPAGAPSRGRLDVLPTGRNLYTVDPRAVPTRTAWEIGRRAAEAVCARFAQDHGDWPRSVVIDLWGSATMRTGGDDFAQAMALLGVRPVWDHASARVSGFEILPPAVLGRPRVDVTLRLSGLFRDVFPIQIALFDQAVRAVAACDEDDVDNPLAAGRRAAQGDLARIFGAAPGCYGIGLGARLQAGDWDTRQDLGEVYLAATSHAYGGADAAGSHHAEAFRARVAGADAYVHGQDMAGQDVLDSDAFAEHEGGFAAAAAALGAQPALYHADGTRPDAPVVRTLGEEVARVVRARASNPRWIAGQMRHGHRGAAEIAETVDNLFAFAALSEAVHSRHFDLVYDATCGNDAVRAFLEAANPQAARAIAGRFAEAERRGFWVTRRNSCATILSSMLEAAE